MAVRRKKKERRLGYLSDFLQKGKKGCFNLHLIIEKKEIKRRSAEEKKGEKGGQPPALLCLFGGRKGDRFAYPFARAKKKKGENEKDERRGP